MKRQVLLSVYNGPICGIGSRTLNADVKAFDKFHIVRGWNSSCCGATPGTVAGAAGTKVPATAGQNKKENKEEQLIRGESTPRDAALTFFRDPESQVPVIATLVANGIPEELARREFKKFILYWTEPNGAGTRERWQLERVFDVSRRLATWFNNANKFERSSSGQPKARLI